MTRIEYHDIVEGEYYLVYDPHNYVTLAKCIIITKNEQGEDLLITLQDCTPYIQLDKDNHREFFIINGEPEKTFIGWYDTDEVYALTEDEIHRHILMELI